MQSNTVRISKNVELYIISDSITQKWAEPATGGVLLKKGVLKSFANFTEKKKTCVGAFRHATLLKIDSNTGAFLKKLRNF